MQTYNDIPIHGTQIKRQPIRFRDSERIAKKQSKKKNEIRIAKRKFLEYNPPSST
jgi:hypothetical protein